jgi:hypothetical protein
MADAYGAFVKSVTTAGTAVRLKSDHFKVAWFAVQPKNGVYAGTGKNSKTVYIGGSDVKNDGTIGFSILPAPTGGNPEHIDHHPTSGGNTYDLYDVWINSEVNGEGVEVIYIIL